MTSGPTASVAYDSKGLFLFTLHIGWLSRVTCSSVPHLSTPGSRWMEPLLCEISPVLWQRKKEHGRSHTDSPASAQKWCSLFLLTVYWPEQVLWPSLMLKGQRSIIVPREEQQIFLDNRTAATLSIIFSFLLYLLKINLKLCKWYTNMFSF